jgi:V8-like Glu-specific endopeptidase
MEPESADPTTADEVFSEDGDWEGVARREIRRAELVEYDRRTIESVDLVEPGRSRGVSTATQPRAEPPRTPRPLRHRSRDATPLHIYNADDRVQYNDLRYPWGLVCRIDTNDGSFGSGVLVGPRHVLTASHVIDWNNLDVTVEVHAHDRTARAVAIAERAGCYTKLGEVGSDEVDEDYAVLVLDQRLGDRFGWMGVRTYESRWDERELWHSVGYADDVGGTRRPQWQRQFYLDEDSLDYGWGRAMDTNADLVHGQSGSPVFGFWERGPYVVAVVSAEVDDDNYCAGGTALTSLVGGVRKAFP